MRVRPANQKGYTHVADWREGGKRHRQFFTSAKAAQLFATKKRDALGLIPRDEPSATPEEFRAIIEARQYSVPLMDAIAHWRRTIGAGSGMLMVDLIAARLEASDADHLSKTHRDSIDRTLIAACEHFGGLAAASVASQDCQGFIGEWTGHHAQKRARAVLGSVFTHAMRMGWLQFNPAGTLKMKRPKASAGVDVFTVDDAAEWLCCVAAHAPTCLAGWSLAMFAGLRRAEVERLDWSEVRLERGYVEITAGKSKTRTRRLVTIQPNLALILEPLALPAGRVFPLSPKRAEAWAFSAYGRPVPKNAARHSFVSYHLALTSDLALTEMEAGHDRKVLFQHYRELVTAEDAAGYFSLVI